MDILNDLLSFEKLESGILILHRENISAMKFMKEGLVIFSPQAKEKGVILDLVSTIDEQTLIKYPNALSLRANDEFSCDRFKMDQVLRNLVSNAIKFSPEGGKVTLQIFFNNVPPTFENNPKKESNKQITSHQRSSTTLSGKRRRSMGDSSHYMSSECEDGDNVFSQKEDEETTEDVHDMESFLLLTASKSSGEVRLGQLIIIVTDSGPGISETNQKKLFRGVIQFDPKKNQGGGGSGFGLFISKGIVDLHKGSIAVHSEGEGHGCLFILSMPMVHTEDNAESVLTLSTPLNMDTDVSPLDTIIAPSFTLLVPMSARKSTRSDYGQNVNFRLSRKIAVNSAEGDDTTTGRSAKDNHTFFPTGRDLALSGRNTSVDADLLQWSITKDVV